MYLEDIVSCRLNLRQNVRGMLTFTLSVRDNTVFLSCSRGEFEGIKSTTVTVSLHQQYVKTKKMIKLKIFIISYALIESCNKDLTLFKYKHPACGHQMYLLAYLVFSRTNLLYWRSGGTFSNKVGIAVDITYPADWNKVNVSAKSKWRQIPFVPICSIGPVLFTLEAMKNCFPVKFD